MGWFGVEQIFKVITMFGYALSRKIVPAQLKIFSEQLFSSSSEVSAQVKFSSRPEQLREHRDRPLSWTRP